MRKVRLVCLLMLVSVLLPAVIKADTVVDDTKPLWGVRVGMDVNIPGNWKGNGQSVKMYSQGYGVTAGAVYNVYLGHNFYFEPGVSLFYDSQLYDDFGILNSNGEIVGSDPSLYKLGVRVPLVVGCAFNINDMLSMSVYTGPELNYAFAGKIRVKDKELLSQGFDTLLFGPNGQRRFDCAWRVGFGVPISCFLVSLDVSLGLTDLLRTSMRYYEYRTSIGITYYM